MPMFRVRVEYAYACDLDVEVEAASERQALESVGGRAYAPSMSAAIKEPFLADNPQIVGADFLVTDVRSLSSAPSV